MISPPEETISLRKQAAGRIMDAGAAGKSPRRHA
jgi:hypothetical protein